MSRMAEHIGNLPPGVSQPDIDGIECEPEWVSCPICGEEVYAADIVTCRDCNRDGCKKHMRKCPGCAEFVCEACWTKDFMCKSCQKIEDSKQTKDSTPKLPRLHESRLRLKGGKP